MTKATWTIPIQVDTQVKSDTRNWLGTVAVNSRLTLSSGVIRGHPGRPAPDQGPDQGSWFPSCRA